MGQNAERIPTTMEKRQGWRGRNGEMEKVRRRRIRRKESKRARLKLKKKRTISGADGGVKEEDY